MLEHLHIENMAVIELADLTFGAGFTVLTGETGAGKSVLIHSLNLLLGERVSKDCVRSGCAKATVCGLFSDLSPEVVSVLQKQGLETDGGELLIQRSLSADGKTTVHMNGRPATVAMLRAVSGKLLNIHGQHDNRALLDPATHLRYLDSFAENQRQNEVYQEYYAQLKSVLKQISSVTQNEQARMQRIDLLEYQCSEIDRARLISGEDELLEQRRAVLEHAEKIETALTSAYEACSGEENARDRIGEALEALEEVAGINETLSSFSERLRGIYEDLEDLCQDIRGQRDETVSDPGELNEVEGRLDLIQRLKKKYGGSIDEILSYRDKSAEELAFLQSSGEIAEHLFQERERLSSLLRSAAERLTESRKKAAVRLESEICGALTFLDMPNTRFHVRILPTESMGAQGADAVEFLLSANLGEDLRPLSKIASGGELSRIMLSMKTVLSDESDAGTLIFDEIDTGVSGKAAEKIARKLKDLSAGKQVLVVTHLAQIAAYADAHFLIAKHSDGKRTYTSVSPLDESGRRDELSRIIAGLNPTQASAAAAQDLLDTGKRYGKA